MQEGGIVMPADSLKHLEKHARGARLDLGDHYQLRLSLNPEKGATGEERFGDCLKQMESLISREKLSLNHAVQLTVFVPREGYGKTVAKYRKQLEELYGSPEDVPPVSFIGQTPAQGKKAALEAVVLAPKKGHLLRINPRLLEADNAPTLGPPRTMSEEEIENLLKLEPGALRGIGGARYSTAQVDHKKWVYSAGLSGNPESQSTPDNARAALAKEMAILIREGMYEVGKPFQRGLINSHHYIHDIIGANYNHLNVQRKEVYDRFGVYPFPSATGIGMFTNPGGVVMELTAARGVDYEPVLVEKHGEAYQYCIDWMKKQAAGQSVGSPVPGSGAGKEISVPRFSRALYLPEEQMMYVSGTASVERGKLLYGSKAFLAENARNNGEGAYFDMAEIAESAGIENLRKGGLAVFRGKEGGLLLRVESAVEAQTLVTIRNMVRLLAAKGLTLKDQAQARIYYTKPEDEGKVKALCGKIFADTPTTYVHGPVCYDDWLVEMESTAAKKLERIR